MRPEELYTRSSVKAISPPTSRIGFGFFGDVADGVVQPAEFAALRKDFWSQKLDRFNCRGPAIDRDIIDAAERSEELGTQFLGECRAADALVHKAIRRDGDYQHIAECPGLLEVANVPDVQEIEDAVAVNDALPGGAQPIEGDREVFKGVNFAVRGHACESLHGAGRVVRQVRSFRVARV